MCLEEKVSRVKIGQKRQEDSEMQKLVKVEEAKAKQRSYEDLCNILDTKVHWYKLAKAEERRLQNVQQS